MIRFPANNHANYMVPCFLPLAIDTPSGVHAAVEAATSPQSLLLVTYVVVATPLCREVVRDARLRAQVQCAAVCAALRSIVKK